MGEFDRQSQIVGQEAPPQLLELITGVAGAEFIRYDAKVSPPARYPDHLYRLNDVFLQLEFAKRVRRECLDQMVRQRSALHLAFGLVPVHQYLVALSQRDAPAEIPDQHRIVIDDGVDRYDPGIRFRVVRLWELDAERAFALDHPSLLPWIPVMNATPEQMREAIRRINAQPNAEELLQRTTAIAPLRLDTNQLSDIMKEGRKTMTYRELIHDTWLYHEIRDEGRQEGRQEGGLVSLRQSIRGVAAKRLGDAGALPGLDQVLSISELQSCLERLATATSVDEAELAIAPYRA